MKKIINNKFKNSGFSVIEVLIACLIISMVSLSLISATTKGISLSNRALRQIQANMLIEEGAEAVKAVRDSSWNNISSLTEENNYLSFASNTWSLSNANQTEVIDGIFTRTIKLSSVNRDANYNIAPTGNIDAQTRKVSVVVSWNSSGVTVSKQISFYINDIFN
jgi:Tfp pilus assembly protein PilV